jgi:hypothetical protein
VHRIPACFAFLCALACIAVAPLRAQGTQQYPAQSIKLLVAFPAGGGADVSARILAAGLAEQLGQSVVVENISGAGGTVGTARAAHAAPDGYTLLVGTPSTHGSNVAVYSKLDYDPVRPPAEAARLDPPSFVTSPNVTQDPSGIAYFDEAIFIQTIRTGRVAGIRPLSRAMLWFEFRKLTDDDLGAIFEFLRSVPPVRHRVNNADPPTYCRRCGRRHGLGELNIP